MLSLVNKGDQTRGLSRRTRETFPDAGSTKMRKRERADIKLKEVSRGNFILGLYYVMANMTQEQMAKEEDKQKKLYKIYM